MRTSRYFSFVVTVVRIKIYSKLENIFLFNVKSYFSSTLIHLTKGKNIFGPTKKKNANTALNN